MAKGSPSKKAASTRPSQPKTFWHPPAVTLIEGALPENYNLETEFSLRRLPQNIDLLIIRGKEAAEPPADPFLPALVTQLKDITLVEFKGGTDSVDGGDPDVLLGYACQYKQHLRAEAKREKSKKKKKRDTGHQEEASLPDVHGELALGFIAPRLTAAFQEGLKEWGETLRCERPGLHVGRLGRHALFFIETEVVWKASPADRFFYVLTRAFLEEGLEKEDMTEEQRELYTKAELTFSNLPREAGMYINPTKLEQIREENRQYMREHISELSPEERLRGLQLEEILQALAPEQLEALRRR